MQEIVNVRIDERLIHGQVAAMWTNVLRASRIMVIDDIASTDEIQKMALKMACPGGINLSILNCEKAALNFSENKYEGDRIFIVVKGPETVLKLWKLGLPLKDVNVGNMSSSVGTKQVKRSVNVTDLDVENFEELAKLGATFTAQMVPNEDKVDFMKLIRK
jgi:PTS system mannose-specific IIB component